MLSTSAAGLGQALKALPMQRHLSALLSLSGIQVRRDRTGGLADVQLHQLVEGGAAQQPQLDRSSQETSPACTREACDCAAMLQLREQRCAARAQHRAEAESPKEGGLRQ